MPCLLPFLFVLNSIAPPPVAMEPDFTQWGSAVTIDHRLYPPPLQPVSSHRPLGGDMPQESGASRQLQRGVLGGLIGAVAGVAACTLLSNAFFNEGGGISSCTTKGNLIFAGTGFALGFSTGWFTGDNHD